MIFKQLLPIFTFFILTPFISSSATYTTINNGSWTNTTNVWSLDGVNPCGCAPSIPTNGDDIIINHNITSNQAIQITNGSSLTVSAGTTFSGNFVLTIDNATANMNGNVTVTKLEVATNAVVNFNASILTVSSQMNIFGTVNVDGSYLLMTGGNVIINQGAVFNTTNAGKVDIQNGNITNSGEFNLCATCCFTSTGNFRNRPTGQVQGSGAVTSTNGNLVNQGSWSFFVAWCSAGNPSGMPGFENCLAADAICQLVILPVEMGEINATLNASGDTEIDWFTVSENNNSHFNILRLNSNKEWDVIGSVHGAGSTTERQDYSFTDYNAQIGTNYYAIEQVDFDGQYSRSEAVSVKKSMNGEITVYPNPASKSGAIHLNFETNDAKTIQIVSSTGRLVYSERIESTSSEINLAEHYIETGLYIINVEDKLGRTSSKLIVE